ncbi:FadR/GntR family transcriptional regulator [Caproiciproducens faecalis]|uniref:FadR family transcriptional regulator n=1 Tax=Caproiciproducens faecalis TaxID=2820301 RepID=A0ABS7DMN6_9FIRM|nr:FadR/GntR family transcriptional regulator [Caproiciproducens faecalis]MBW7572327.1 FadR family transcriptional regulator [Caproiciproducens faecalis]
MEQIKKISLTDTVVDTIKEQIIMGTFKAGEKFAPEALLCKELDVSRPTLREAFKVLEAMGYVELKSGKGSFVADWKKTKENSKPLFIANSATFQEYIQVRQGIEPIAMRLAVEKLTDEKYAELEAIHSAFINAINKKDPAQLLLLDEAFHQEIIKLSGNKLLINISKGLVNLFRQFRAYTFSDSGVYSNALPFHSEILKQMKERNVEESVNTITRHLQTVESDMHALLGMIMSDTD